MSECRSEQFFSMAHGGRGRYHVYKVVMGDEVIWIGEAAVFSGPLNRDEIIKSFMFRDGSHWGVANKCVVAIDAFLDGVEYAKGKQQ